ncbi:methyltransferase domain-containing protein [Candidatus Saccharibacteria bacterium]|nr:methyltransferase domain-containing protein [Candidatus Saccharibacteria bacterium]
MTEKKSTKSAPVKTAASVKTNKSTKSAKNTKAKSPQPEKVVSDYNGYDYKKIFWEDADREYEDQADRLAIRRLLPEKMDKFVDIAGGYGRLAKEYLGRAKSATIFDYSKTELKQAKEEFGDKISTKAGDIYNIPFKDNTFDALMMIRATHHFNNMPKVIAELYRILKPGGIAVIEVANKRTLPKMFRYWFRGSDVNPFDKKPSNLKGLNKDGFYNYHPAYIEEVFENAGFEIEEVLSVSNFRSTTLKKIFTPSFLMKLEKPTQKLFAAVKFAPSIYYKLKKPE